MTITAKHTYLYDRDMAPLYLRRTVMNPKVFERFVLATKI